MKAALLLCLLGCTPQAIRDQQDGRFPLTFHNATSGAVCAIHIYRFGQAERGSNWLAPQTDVPAGGEIQFRVVPETYQLYAGGCPYEHDLVTGYAPQIIVNAASTVVLFNEADAASKSKAQALAHANENSTQIPAKYKRVKSPAPRPADQRPADQRPATRR